MKILITGGAGFIGSHLCDKLILKKHDVTAIDDLSMGKKENISHLFGNPSFSFIMENINNTVAIDHIFSKEKFDTIFHLAANSDIAQSINNPAIDFDKTFLTTFTLLDLMRKHEIKKLFFASTSAIYGAAADKLHEDYGPLIPVSHYGAAKLASEAFISSFAECYGLQVWITRFPNVVGERATHGVIFDFINKLRQNPDELEVLGNGEQNKPYIYVKDLIDAMLFIHKKCNEKINIYNIGVNSRTKVKKIAQMVIDEMKLNASIKYTGGVRGWIGDVPEFRYDTSKINKLGWDAKTSSDEAVRKSIQYILGKDS